MLRHLSPPRRRFFLGLIALAGLALVAGVVGAVLSREPAVTPAAQDRLGPVLLVPGYGGDTTSLEVLTRALRDAGRDARIVTPPGDGTGDLREQARRLDEVAEELVADGAPSVDVVGYSAGGVVVRWWVDQLGGAPLARRVVSLAAPQHGSEVAGLAADLTGDSCPEACAQLAPGSELIRTLDSGDETPPGPRWVTLWTTDDSTVVPPTSGSLQGATAYSVQSVCPGLVVEHSDVPRTDAVIEMVSAALGTADPSVPGPEVC